MAIESERGRGNPKLDSPWSSPVLSKTLINNGEIEITSDEPLREMGYGIE
jgi:hypothetical protein